MSVIETMRLVPWALVKRTIRRYRSRYPVPWPERYPTATLDMTPDELEARLRADGFEGTIYAVKYRGEVLSLRRPDGTNGEGARELHVRARPVDGGVEVNAHREYSRFEEKVLHLEQADMVWLDESELEGLVR